MSKSTKSAAPHASAAVAPVADKPSRARRAPVKALNKTPQQIAANAAAEKARKAASKKALRAALAPAATTPAPVVEKSAETRAAEHEAYLAALRVDAAALGVDPEAYIAEQLAPVKTKYTGPMLALRSAAKTYVKAPNGQPCCGDDLAALCGWHSRDTVVKALILAMGLPGNPYLHLNPGQQSMNLRNKARAQLKAGTLTAEQVEAAFAQVAPQIAA